MPDGCAHDCAECCVDGRPYIAPCPGADTEPRRAFIPGRIPYRQPDAVSDAFAHYLADGGTGGRSYAIPDRGADQKCVGEPDGSAVGCAYPEPECAKLSHSHADCRPDSVSDRCPYIQADAVADRGPGRASDGIPHARAHQPAYRHANCAADRVADQLADRHSNDPRRD